MSQFSNNVIFFRYIRVITPQLRLRDKKVYKLSWMMINFHCWHQCQVRNCIDVSLMSLHKVISLKILVGINFFLVSMFKLYILIDLLYELRSLFLFFEFIWLTSFQCSCVYIKKLLVMFWICIFFLRKYIYICYLIHLTLVYICVQFTMNSACLWTVPTRWTALAEEKNRQKIVMTAVRV